jgi:hypothetical protein
MGILLNALTAVLLIGGFLSFQILLLMMARKRE